MMFIEERLLECVADGTSGGPTFRTRRIPLRSGVVRRNPLQALPLYRYSVNYRNLQAEQHAAVIAAFNACLAGVHSFRLKDWEDFTATDETLPVLGTGAEQQIQLVKTYTFGTQTLSRRIRKPVVDTVVVKTNGVPSVAVVDYTTGIITITAPNAAVLTWTGEFDVPVFFENDELPFAGDNVGNHQRVLTGDVPLLEDRAA